MKVQKENEIIEKEEQVRNLQRQRFGPEGDLFRKRQELVAPVQEKVFGAIEDFAADRGYDLIFDKNGSTGILFTSDNFDKTADLKKRLGIKN
jgi:outer membrane protein